MRFGPACLRSRMPAPTRSSAAPTPFWSIIGLAGMTICGTPNDKRSHRGAVPAVSDYQRCAGENLVMVEPGVHRRVRRHPQACGVDSRPDRHRRLDGQRRNRVENVLEHSTLPGEGTSAEADQDSRHRCRDGGLGHSLPHDTGMAYRRMSAHRVEVGPSRDDMQQSLVFWRKRIRTAQTKCPSDRAGCHVLNRAIKAMDENDRRDAGVDDLGCSCDEDHVDDDRVHVVTPRRLGHGLAEASIRRDAGERRHEGSQWPRHGGIEMPSVGERFERKTGGFDSGANPSMAEHLDRDAASLKRSRDRQLRRDVAAAVHDREQNLHGATAGASNASVMNSIRSRTSSTDSPRSRRISFHA